MTSLSLGCSTTDRDELMAIADELENKFFVVYDSHGEIDHADCFVERIMKAVDA